MAGNIRELENVIQGAVILADGDSITRADLPCHLQGLVEDEAADQECEFEPDCFEDMLRQYKTHLANKAVTECNGKMVSGVIGTPFSTSRWPKHLK